MARMILMMGLVFMAFTIACIAVWMIAKTGA